MGHLSLAWNVNLFNCRHQRVRCTAKFMRRHKPKRRHSIQDPHMVSNIIKVVNEKRNYSELL